MRWIELDGVANLRDIGGYPTVDGQWTRWRTVYRSGSLDALGDADAERVRGLGVRTVIDFREDRERAGDPAWLRGAEAEVVRIPTPNPATSHFAPGQYDPVALSLADLDARGRALAEVVKVVSDPSRLPAMVQCSGGKDRTGIMVGLLLSLLGVEDAVVAEDYALSDEFRTRDPEGFAQALERVTAAGFDPEVLRTRAETMTGLLEGVKARHGSAAALAVAGGAPNETLDSARANLVERPPGPRQ